MSDLDLDKLTADKQAAYEELRRLIIGKAALGLDGNGEALR